jgi:hypothetical protein
MAGLLGRSRTPATMPESWLAVHDEMTKAQILQSGSGPSSFVAGAGAVARCAPSSQILARRFMTN